MPKFISLSFPYTKIYLSNRFIHFMVTCGSWENLFPQKAASSFSTSCWWLVMNIYKGNHCYRMRYSLMVIGDNKTPKNKDGCHSRNLKNWWKSSVTISPIGKNFKKNFLCYSNSIPLIKKRNLILLLTTLDIYLWKEIFNYF